MKTSPSYQAYSAEVWMRLFIGETSMRIAQMGPDFLIVDADAAYAPSDATILMRVDAEESQWEVYLPHGIPAGGRQEVSIALPLEPVIDYDGRAEEMVERSR